MQSDAKVISAIHALPRIAACEVLDEAFGNESRDECSLASLRKKVMDGYTAGRIDGAVIVMAYFH